MRPSKRHTQSSNMLLDTIKINQDSIFIDLQGRLDQVDSTIKSINVNQDEISKSLNSINTLFANTNEMQSLLIGAIIGAIFGLILSILATWIALQFKYRTFKKALSKYSGIYLAINKYDKEAIKVYRCFELRQYRNTFIIEDGISVLGNEDYNALITINENNLNHGTGYYRHNIGPEGTIKFGFLEIQLAGSEILVHETIYNQEGKQNSDAYRWVKQDFSKRHELFEKYRNIQLSEKKRIYES